MLKNKTLPIDLYGYETWSLILKKGNGATLLENMSAEEDIYV
jgi:hypothetical protein